MKKKFQFILINTLILMGSHSSFSMNNTEENNSSRFSLAAPLPQAAPSLFKPIPNSTEIKSTQYAAKIKCFETGSEEDKFRLFPSLLQTILDPRTSVLDRVRGSEVIFSKGTPEQKEAVVVQGDMNFYTELLPWIPQLSYEFKKQICSNLIYILEHHTSVTDLIRAEKLLLNFGTPQQKEENVSVLVALSKSFIPFKNRMEATFCLFCDGTLEQKKEVFTAGGIDFDWVLFSWISQISPESKKQVCSDLTYILGHYYVSTTDLMRAGNLLLTFGTPQQKETSASTLMALAQSSNSRENRMDATFCLFHNGTLEQKKEVFTVGGMDFDGALLSWIPQLPPQGKEQICSALTYIAEHHISATDRIRAGDLLLNFGMPQQKETSVSTLMAWAKSSTPSKNRMDATFYLFRNGSSEQKAEAFTAGSIDFDVILSSWIPQLSPESKKLICFSLRYILDHHTSVTDRIRAGQLLLNFGTSQQKEASVFTLMALAKNSSIPLKERMDATFCLFLNGTLKQKEDIFTAGDLTFYNELWSLIPTLSPEIKEQICSNLTYILGSHLSAIDRIRAGNLLLNFGTPQQIKDSISVLLALAKISIPLQEERMNALLFILLNGTLEQKKEAFTAGGTDFCSTLLSWIPNLSPETKECVCSCFTDILEGHTSEIDRLRAGKLLFKFGTPHQKEASISVLTSLPRIFIPYKEDRMYDMFYRFFYGTLEQKTMEFSAGSTDFRNILLSWIPQLPPQGKEQICSALTYIAEHHISAKDHIRAGQLLFKFGTPHQKEASVSMLMELDNFGSPFEYHRGANYREY